MKGMTNALPVLIDASTLATKSDISDMETKTNANATFATKTALTTLQNSVGDAFSQVAVGSDGKSLDFTALDGQVNNVVLPDISNDWVDIVYDSDHPNTNIDSSKIKIGTQIIAYEITESGPSEKPYTNSLNITCCNIDETTFYFAGSGVYAEDTVRAVGYSFRIFKSNIAQIKYWANAKEITASFAYGVFSYAKIKY